MGKKKTNHDPKDPISSRHQRVSRPPILCREQLGSDGVEDAVHDVACEAVGAVPAQESVGRAGGGGDEDEDPC